MTDKISKKSWIIMLLQQKVSVSEIMKRLQTGRGYVTETARHCGLNVRRPVQKLTLQDRTEIFDLIRNQAMTQKAIAFTYGISQALVSRYAVRIHGGVQRRRTEGHSQSRALSEARGAATS